MQGNIYLDIVRNCNFIFTVQKGMQQLVHLEEERVATLNNMEDSTGEEEGGSRGWGSFGSYTEDYDEDRNDHRNCNDHFNFNNFVEEGEERSIASV